MGETAKARPRREREKWFEKYCPVDQPGIDIGCHNDPVHDSFRQWDLRLGDTDALFMEGVEDNTYQTVYASHVLEHLPNAEIALHNWYRICKPGGHIIVIVPHRDLYECKKELPSHWNPEHVAFFLPEKAEPPHTYSFKHTILAAIPNADIVDFRVIDEGYHRDPGKHPSGEYAIEAIIRKR